MAAIYTNRYHDDVSDVRIDVELRHKTVVNSALLINPCPFLTTYASTKQLI